MQLRSAIGCTATIASLLSLAAPAQVQAQALTADYTDQANLYANGVDMNGHTLTYAGSSSFLTAGSITDSSPGAGGRLAMTGTGTRTLAAANTFGGGISVSAGTLNLAAAGAAGSGGLTVNTSSIGGVIGNNVTVIVSAADAFANSTALALTGGLGSWDIIPSDPSIEGSKGFAFETRPGALMLRLTATNALGSSVSQLSLAGGNAMDAYIVADRGGRHAWAGVVGGSTALDLSAANAISTTTNLILAGGMSGSDITVQQWPNRGSFTTASGGAGGIVSMYLNGFSQSIGTLQVTNGTAVLDFGAGSNGSSFLFADSSALAWNGSFNLLNYGAGDVFAARDTAVGLTNSQLADIFFVNPAGMIAGTYSAQMSSGQVTPGSIVATASAPEPDALALLASALPLLSRLLRRRIVRSSTKLA